MKNSVFALKRSVVLAQPVPIGPWHNLQEEEVRASIPQKDPRSFLSEGAGIRLGQLQGHLEAARQTSDPGLQHELLAELYVGIHALVEDARNARLASTGRLAAALQGLLQRLLERPDLRTISTLHNAALALDILEQRSLSQTEPSLTEPPLRILAVDDDPVARRAIALAVQSVFGRPDTTDSGEAAVELANLSRFDLIFMDVRMPGMDGFTTCNHVHQTVLNRQTPVVFVTNHNDLETCAQAARAGGCGFIPKPVLAKEILLTALAFCVRSRLNAPLEPIPPPSLPR